MKTSELTIILALAGGGGKSTPGRLAEGLYLGHDTVRRALKRLQSGWLVLRRGQSLIVNSEHPAIHKLKLAAAATAMKRPWTLLMTIPSAVEALGLLYKVKKAKISELDTESILSQSSLRKGVAQLLENNVVVAGEKHGYYVLALWEPGVDEWSSFAAEIRLWLPFDSELDPLNSAGEDPRLTMAVVYGSHNTPKYQDELSDIDLLVVARQDDEVREVEADYKVIPNLDVSVMSERAFLSRVERQPSFAASLAFGKILKGKNYLDKCLKH